MNIEALEALSYNLAEPLNQSAQAADGAGFALIFSLMFEAGNFRSVHGGISGPQSNDNLRVPDVNELGMQLDGAISTALSKRNFADFALLNSFYSERLSGLKLLEVRPQADSATSRVTSDVEKFGRRSSDALLKELEDSRQYQPVVQAR